MTLRKAKTLVVDDDASLLEMMRLTLTKEGLDVRTAASAGEARVLLDEAGYELVISDIYLGDGSAIDLLDQIHTNNPRAAVILMTAQGTIETAAAARRAGVFDYLAKPFKLAELVDRVHAAVGGHGAPSAPVEAGPESMIIGNHPRIVEVFKAVARVAPTDVPVLIRGETGTGKELVARALHRFGGTPDGPFVAINCGAIPEALLESELFGHRRGAFTGADRDHRGAIESAGGGTVLLDEVGELPPQLQVKLLRFLQEGEIRPVGSDHSREVDVRVVAATHRDLGADVRSGSFREDFFYRLSAYEIELPPLRERRSDIPRLVEHFRHKAAARIGRRELPGPSSETLQLLEAHPWPGNVRELENLVQRALIDLGTLADAGGIRRLLPSVDDLFRADETMPAIGDDLSLEEVERLHIEAVVAKCGGNKTRAAEILGIDRKSLYRKIERLGIRLSEDSAEP